MLILLHLIKDLFLETTSVQVLENNTNWDYANHIPNRIVLKDEKSIPMYYSNPLMALIYILYFKGLVNSSWIVLVTEAI